MNDENPQAKEKQKSDAVKAALLSAFVIPGAGQFYNREWLKGIFVAILFLTASLSVLVPITIGIILYYSNLGGGDIEQASKAIRSIWEARIQLIVLAVCSIILYVYSVIDAYRKGQSRIPENNPPSQLNE